VASDVTQKTNYKALIATGLISLAVAVGGNIVVNKLSEENLSLSYELTASETFGGSNGNIRISNIEISNNGTKSIDDVVLSISLQEGVIDDHKVNGIPANSYAVDKKNDKLILNTKYINPEEKFYIQLLLSNPQNSDFLPLVDLRGRGVIGKQAIKKSGDSFLSSIATAIAALGVFASFLTFRKTRSRILDTDLIRASFSDIGETHSGDQRDIFAYILGINGLKKEADEIRFIERDISYWSISDHLVELWCGTKDSELMIKGATALNELIAYARIREDSVKLIQTGIARLYAEAGNPAAVQKVIETFKNEKDEVIKSRLVKSGLLENA